MQVIHNKLFGYRLNKFFDKIYCINLDSRPDRWQYVRDHFSKFGLGRKVERFSAVDVRNDPGLKDYEQLINDNFSLLAMCGCMLSHRKIIEMGKKSGLNRILVFEDDVRILDRNTRTIHKSLKALEQRDWEVLYLGATYLFPLKRVGSYLVNTPEGAYATHAIAYSSNIFDQVLELLPSNPVDYMQKNDFRVNAIDKWLQSNYFDHHKFFGTNPIMVVQGLQESDIAFNQKDDIEQTQVDLFYRNLTQTP